MQCERLKNVGGTISEEDEWEAEIFTLQSEEWMKDCPHKDRCPGARMFTHLLAMYSKVKRLEHELKRVREFPDEG